MTWNLLTSIDYEDEKCKNYIVKVLHDALLTKSKIIKRVRKKVSANITNHTNNTYWQSKYPHIKNNLCVLCKTEAKTIEYFVNCKNTFVQKKLARAYRKIRKITKSNCYWFHTSTTVPNPEDKLGEMSRTLGSAGLLPKNIFSEMLKTLKNPKDLKRNHAENLKSNCQNPFEYLD